MAIGPIGGIGPLAQILPPAGTGGANGASGVAGAGRAEGAQGSGFGAALERGLQSVSNLEHHADALIQDVATGGPTKVHELMVATTESALAVDLLVQVRDRALEAYHEVMRLQL